MSLSEISVTDFHTDRIFCPSSVVFNYGGDLPPCHKRVGPFPSSLCQAIGYRNPLGEQEDD